MPNPAAGQHHIDRLPRSTEQHFGTHYTFNEETLLARRSMPGHSHYHPSDPPPIIHLITYQTSQQFPPNHLLD